jgi:membrane-associated protease RseP (regulator of RpoE activity)
MAGKPVPYVRQLLEERGIFDQGLAVGLYVFQLDYLGQLASIGAADLREPLIWGKPIFDAKKRQVEYMAPMPRLALALVIGEKTRVDGYMKNLNNRLDSDEALKGMLAAQATWDATMAWNAVKALEAVADPQAIMVVLVGAGHVAYGLGIERQARRYFHGDIASIIPVPVADDDGTPITSVRASYATCTWGVAGERESVYPSLGISLVPMPGGRSILDVQKDTVGARAGLLVGDLVTTIDGQAVTGKETWNRVMAGKNWGDVVTLGLTRGGEPLTVRIPLRRAPPTPPTSK